MSGERAPTSLRRSRVSEQALLGRRRLRWLLAGVAAHFFGLAQLQYRCASRAFAGMVFPPSQYISM